MLGAVHHRLDLPRRVWRAWTFLYPLPILGVGLWSPHAAALFMLGYLLIGVGSLLFYFDAAAAIIKVHGNLGRALGLQWLFGGTIDPGHPKTVVASTMVIIANSLGILAGAVVLVMSLISIFYPQITLDALLAKNLIYWFGHMYINATIYMGVIAVYELLPRYSGKPYPISRPFLWSWAASTLFVIIVFPHHLMIDFAQPRWLTITGQVVSWGAGFPVFVVTMYGALANIYRSGIRWTMPARLMVLSLFGWAAGILPAILDGTIRNNLVLHNTQWVPGHSTSTCCSASSHGAAPRDWQPRECRPTPGPTAWDSACTSSAGWCSCSFLDAGHLSVARRMAATCRRGLPRTRSARSAPSWCSTYGLRVRITGGLLRSPPARCRMPVLRALLASLLITAAISRYSRDRRLQGVHEREARRIDVRKHPRALPASCTAEGRRVGLGSLRGRWALIDFIYTRCTTYCSCRGSVRGCRRNWPRRSRPAMSRCSASASIGAR